jgi:hypothetical protein
MQIKLTHLKVGNMHKVLVLDKERTKKQGQLLFIGESLSQNLALQDALDFVQMLKMGVHEEHVFN